MIRSIFWPCRALLKEPHDSILRAIQLLQDEENENLPEGQLLLQVRSSQFYLWNVAVSSVTDLSVMYLQYGTVTKLFRL